MKEPGRKRYTPPWVNDFAPKQVLRHNLCELFRREIKPRRRTYKLQRMCSIFNEQVLNWSIYGNISLLEIYNYRA